MDRVQRNLVQASREIAGIADGNLFFVEFLADAIRNSGADVDSMTVGRLRRLILEAKEAVTRLLALENGCSAGSSAIDEMSIPDLLVATPTSLAARISNALAERQILTIADLKEVGWRQLCTFRLLGSTSLGILVEALSLLGVRLEGSPPPGGPYVLDWKTATARTPQPVGS